MTSAGTRNFRNGFVPGVAAHRTMLSTGMLKLRWNFSSVSLPLQKCIWSAFSYEALGGGVISFSRIILPT
jgi:hypothetical protein